jgi:tetratricopeptide (TPR) repeat protein
VSKKKGKHAPQPLTPDALKGRIERARHEGRFQQALELCKQLYKEQPTPAHQDLLRQVYLGRARQLRGVGAMRDAAIVLEHALHVGAGDPAWLAQVAEELAACGQTGKAMEVLNKLPPSPAHAKVLAQAADAAVPRGPAGRNQLPEALRASFDAIVHAFTQVEAGQDEAARQTLQGIGLQSPFLEWKLLLRGLQAYYQKDDARAIENWQRLSAERTPARLAAPLRFLIDPAYRTAQPPAAQTGLQRHADRLQGHGLVSTLRIIQAALANAEQLAQAFRLAESLMPALRQQAPQLVPRLAACFYWTVISSGEPEDAARYQRVFGIPADDPKLARLRAMLHEHLMEMDKAHRYWQEFEQSVAANAAAWPSDQANRVRALVWCRMGHNAAAVPDTDSIPDLPPFLRDHPSRPRPLTPSAEKCFQRSLELAPDQLEPYEELFHFFQDQEKDDKAEKAARQLLKHFPNHVPTLVALSDLRSGKQDYAEALSLLQRALKLNPLDRRLRSKISSAHLFHARQFAEVGEFDAARAEYQASLTFREGKDEASVWCKWAACEFKAGDTPRAEELMQKAHAEAGSGLAVAFSMVIEAIRLKLTPALKRRFDKEFNDGLAAPPTGPAVAAVLDTAAAHRIAGVSYRGQKTHEKKVLTYLDKATKVPFSEDELDRICHSLLGLKALKPLHTFAEIGQNRFPQDPLFWFLDAESFIAQGPYRCPIYRVAPLLERAQQLAEQLPPDERRKTLLDTIQQRRQLIGIGGGLFGGGPEGMFGEVFDELFGYADEDDDDY